MRTKGIFTAASALAMAIALAPLSHVQAASLISPGSKVQVEGLTQIVKAKRHHHRMGRHAHSKGPGRCGENMYWSGKGHHCMDARDKA